MVQNNGKLLLLPNGLFWLKESLLDSFFSSSSPCVSVLRGWRASSCWVGSKSTALCFSCKYESPKQNVCIFITLARINLQHAVRRNTLFFAPLFGLFRLPPHQDAHWQRTEMGAFPENSVRTFKAPNDDASEKSLDCVIIWTSKKNVMMCLPRKYLLRGRLLGHLRDSVNTYRFQATFSNPLSGVSQKGTLLGGMYSKKRRW